MPVTSCPTECINRPQCAVLVGIAPIAIQNAPRLNMSTKLFHKVQASVKADSKQVRPHRHCLTSPSHRAQTGPPILLPHMLRTLPTPNPVNRPCVNVWCCLLYVRGPAASAGPRLSTDSTGHAAFFRSYFVTTSIRSSRLHVGPRSRSRSSAVADRANVTHRRHNANE